MSGSPESATFIGRGPLVAQALASLTAASSPGCVLVGAEGVGKSCLAWHCADQVAATGRHVMRVLATRSAASIPLGAFAPYVCRCDDHPQALQDARRDITGVAQPGAPRPVILVDDAHLLDEHSATLLLTLVHANEATVLATYRTGEPCPDAVTALWKDFGLARIEVKPFDDDELRHFARVILGADPPGPVLGQLSRLSGNRPLALRELLRPVECGGVMVRNDAIWSIHADASAPSGIVELLTSRLDGMNEPELAVLTTLALCEPLPVEVCEQIGGVDAFESLLRYGYLRTLRRSEDIHGGWIFKRRPTATVNEVRLDHPLIGDVAIARASARAIRTHYIAAATALNRYSDDPFEAVRATLWRLKAGEELSVDELLLAAQREYRQGSYHRCGELARAAWEREKRFAAGHLLGFAMGRAGRCNEANELLSVVESVAVTEWDLAQVTLTRAEILHQGLGDAEAADELCRRTEAKLTDSKIRGEVTAYRAVNVAQAGKFFETMTMLEPFLDHAVAGDRAFVKASYPAGVALAHLGRSDDATALALQAMPIHEALWEREWFQTEPGVHHVTTLMAMISAGRYVEAEDLLAIAREATRESDPPYAYAWMCLLSGRVALRHGRCMDAIGHSRIAIDLFRRGSFLGPVAWGHAGLAAACALHGDLDAARQELQHVAALPNAGLATSLVAEANGWLWANSGDLIKAREAFVHGATDAVVRGDNLGALHLWLGVARCGDPALALEGLRPLVDGYQGDNAQFCVSVAEALEGTHGRTTIDAVIAQCATRKMDLLAAEVCIADAAVLEARGERRNATRRIDAARTFLQCSQGGQTPLSAGFLASRPLSGRERDIAHLAAQRMASKQIGARLGISARTVDNHLGRIYRKLEISGRDELADALREDSPWSKH